MAHGATVPLGKSMRRALRTAIGIPKKNKPPPPPLSLANSSGRDPGVSMELSSSSSVAARKEAVVRVVMRGGVVEVYPGVVLACTVIRNHPPGLCLAHPDVFRNPHGAVVRPLEPLFPGQKFLLLPETTVVRLKQKIPESSIGAFADEEEYGDEDETSSSSSSSSDEGGAMTACSARDYFVARDRWSECRFRRLVEQGFAVEPSDDDEPAEREKDRARATTKRRKRRRRRDRRSSPVPHLLPVGLRGFATARRTWEPSLPSVEEEEEEEAAVSPGHPPPSEANKRSCMNRYQ